LATFLLAQCSPARVSATAKARPTHSHQFQLYTSELWGWGSELPLRWRSRMSRLATEASYSLVSPNRRRRNSNFRFRYLNLFFILHGQANLNGPNPENYSIPLSFFA